ncbi:hypothetical protein [Fodinibius halophilus]|uniref:YcxB family protein n=1 Tax=Fodinibius halophilus TaxID=1736908 RepID=A0A6M1T5U1_9BACT|nr:hypothetical protein [Fodinibius halophilus]NGP89429.1 hypothetical protein [Fodinibius halophilus]
MDDFTITYRDNQSLTWLRYLVISLGVLHLSTVGIHYWQYDIDWTSYIYLFTGAIEIFIGLFRFEQYFFPYPELTFSDKEIIIEEGKEKEKLPWDIIKEITIDSTSIIVVLADDQKEINIQYLNYGDIQNAKQEIKQRAEKNGIAYNSVF